MKAVLAMLLVSSLGLSACSVLRRSESSGYAHYDGVITATDEYFRDKTRYEELQAREDLGFESRPLNDNEAQLLATRLRVRRLEKTLQSTREKTQYYGYKPYMNERERENFLSLPTAEARERWAQSVGVPGRTNTYSPTVSRMIENNDVIVGMTKKAVLESWGEPDTVDVAGNPLYENERWRYAKTVSSTDGYNREARIIYFEAGRVVGWETTIAGK